MVVLRSAYVCQNRASQFGRLGIEYTPQNLRCKMLNVFSFISNGTLTANKLRNFIRQSSREAISTQLAYHTLLRAWKFCYHAYKGMQPATVLN